jgi:hypothetical protein
MNQVDEDGFDLQAYESLLRSHVHVAFSLLGFGTVTESVQRELITSTIGLFAGADSYGGSGLQAAIAAREGTFRGVWRAEDGYAYGVNGIDLNDGGEIDTGTGGSGMGGISSGGAAPAEGKKQSRDPAEAAIDNMVSVSVPFLHYLTVLPSMGPS